MVYDLKGLSPIFKIIKYLILIHINSACCFNSQFLRESNNKNKTSKIAFSKDYQLNNMADLSSSDHHLIIRWSSDDNDRMIEIIWSWPKTQKCSHPFLFFTLRLPNINIRVIKFTINEVLYSFKNQSNQLKSRIHILNIKMYKWEIYFIARTKALYETLLEI